ncbi:MAG TPA: toxic anion resistance protein [Atopostipes sp.]|nr:toxic anion resistance protein [Atopostipes sp.]
MSEQERTNEQLNPQENTNERSDSMATIDDLLENPFDTPQTMPELEIQTQDPEQEERQAGKTYDHLPAEQQEQAQKLAEQIDYTDTDSVLNYGSAAQQKIGDFSHNVLNHVQNQETGAIGNAINDLMFQLEESNPDELVQEDQNFIQRFFKRAKRSIYETTAKYQKIGAQVDKIAHQLDKQKDMLLEDNKMLTQLYEQNLEYYKALNVYIAAGELRLEELENEIIPKALKEAEETPDQMLVQKVNDLNQYLNRLDKRVHDLRVTRQITLQQAPQIRLIQNTNQALAERIQTSINTAIPLWKNQIVISLTLLRKQDAVAAQRRVSDATNEMLQKNSEMLKQSSIDTARETERAVVDIETLQKTQSDLIETLQETLAIQQEGSQKRREAEQQLVVMEDQLRDQLLEVTQQSQADQNQSDYQA